MTFGRSIRDRWLLEPGITFLNHGSFGATPRSVLAVQAALRERLERTPVRFLEWAREEGIPSARAACAPFLGTNPEGMVFVDNATTGVAAVLQSLQLGPADVLLATDHGYGAVALALRHAAERAGARVETVPIACPIQTPDAVVQALRGALHRGVKLAVVDWITSPTGLILPMAEIVRVCHDAGVPVLVDGAHVPGHIPCDLDTLGADWFVGNAHKWLFAPKGAAFLVVRPEHRSAMHPPVISWGYGEGWQAEFDWLGTRDPTPWLAAPDGIRFLDDLGFEDARTYTTGLRREAVALLQDAWGWTPPIAPEGMLGNLATLALPFPTEPSRTAARRLNEALYERHGIEVPFFPWGDKCWLRISVQVYNEIDDYRRLASAIGPDGIR